ncbi:hypothetical protein [Noviherbaspirillum humi]|uniref:hypothetical protein n=1 Tax=Noviherbaspirillum humi TaxID=1688639 RepID=UPI001595C594|nr:hypothetical protein [Noviherbaspirillum humi]
MPMTEQEITPLQRELIPILAAVIRVAVEQRIDPVRAATTAAQAFKAGLAASGEVKGVS